MNPTIQATASKQLPINGSVDREHAKARLHSGEPVLSEETLARFAARAAAYDRENRFSNKISMNSVRRGICCCLYPRNSAVQV